MTDSRPTPRLFVVRHGETEWSKNGHDFKGQTLCICLLTSYDCVGDMQTGLSDIPLTANGVDQVKKTAQGLTGEGRIVDPKNLCTVHVSPRQRARKTFELLFEHTGALPTYVLDEDVQEWNYGDYEGLKPAEIQAIRPGWKIWHDGCPGGESVEDMQARVDKVIAKVRKYHREYKEEGKNSRDVLIVAHGHFTRVLISRWINFPLCLGTHFNAEPGALTILSYNHNSLDEPALNGLNIAAI